MSGSSQAVLIPHEFRLQASRVEITRTEAGELLIRPLPGCRGRALLEALDAFDDEFVQALEEVRAQPARVQGRDSG